MLFRNIPLFLCSAAIPLWITSAFAEPVQVQILSAVVKDQRIPDATVILQKNGAQSVTAHTNDQGAAELNTGFDDTDASLIIVKKEGYSNLVAKCPCKGMTYAISPIMTNLDGLRIVLNWGAEPADLDSHLVFPNAHANSPDQQSFNHIFFAQQTGPSGTDANLDVDNTKGFGPETITIEKKHQGETYVYSVHDYIDREDPASARLSRSGAKVLVYIGQSLVRSYYVPKKVVGNLWTVFRITPEGEFQDINTVTSTSFEQAASVIEGASTYLNRTTEIAAPVISARAAGDAKALNKSGEDAYHTGELDRAIDLYRQAIDIDSNYGQAYSNLGLAFQKSNRMAEAIWANRKAIALASGSAAATTRASSYYNIGRIYEAAAQFSDALAQYQSAAREKANPVYDKAIQRMKAKAQ